LRRHPIEDVFHLDHASDQAPIETPMALQILHTLREMPSVANRTRNPHDHARGDSSDSDDLQNGGLTTTVED
jgi:hypothetical protein